MKKKGIWIAWSLAITVLLVTIYASFYIKSDIDYIAKKDFDFNCSEISYKINRRLHAHAQILQSGAAFISASDTIAREEWKLFIEKSNVHINIPGIQGTGFSVLVPEEYVEQHIKIIKNEGFPDYTIWPDGKRDTYSSVIFLEPFIDRNRQALGYDMMSEPVRKEAMERARDMGIAALSGKVMLVQENGTDTQAGNLMYVPVYRKGAQTNTLEQRRKAVVGWVYSPYRMDDLMSGILDDWYLDEDNRFYVRIFDGTQVLPESLLFDSHSSDEKDKLGPIRFSKQIAIDFNKHNWTLVFTQTTKYRFFDYISVWIVLIGGTITSILLFFFIRSLINTKDRAIKIAKKLTFELENAKQRLEIVVTSSTVMLYAGETFGDFNATFISDNIFAVTGYTKEEFLTKGFWASNIHPDDAPKVVENIGKLLEHNKHYHEYRFMFKDGTYHWMADELNLIRDENGNPLEIIGTWSNINERKLAEEEIYKLNTELEKKVEERTKQLAEINKNLYNEIKERKQAEEQIVLQSTALNNAANAIVITDRNADIEWVNLAFTKLTGYTLEDVVGKNQRILKSGKQDTDFYKNLWGTVLAGKVWDGELINKRKDKSEYTEDMTITPLKNEKGEIVRFVAIKRDNSERKKIELELKLAKAKAESANHAKSEFLANMSHEIRTPLNAVLGYSELLGSMVEDKIQKDYIESIKSSGRSLLTIINDILDLSKIEAGKIELEFDYININSFFSEFERIFSLEISKKGLEFILDIASGTPAGIYIDEARLRQVLLNIIGNAVKFTANGHIKLKVYIENPQILNYTDGKSKELIDLIIEIEDTGIGISKELQEKIFKPFTQQSGQQEYGGTGLGLVISHRLVKLLNGTITLQSELRKGSTFRIKFPEIPYLRNIGIEKTEIQINIGNIEFEKATILVVDNVEHNRKYLTDTLKNTNITVLEAENGQQAYKLAKEEILDLIITDIQMPILDGFGLLNKIKGNKTLKHIPVIAYSASVMKEQIERIHKSEFAGMLIKPVQVSELYIELLNFLPYKQNKTEIPETAGKIEYKELSIPELTIPEFAKDFNSLVLPIWNSVKERRSQKLVSELSSKVQELGEKYNSKNSIEFGSMLKIANDSFNVEEVRSLLKRFEIFENNLKKNKNK